MDLTIGLAIPFLGTTLGSAMVFFMKNKLSVITFIISLLPFITLLISIFTEEITGGLQTGLIVLNVISILSGFVLSVSLVKNPKRRDVFSIVALCVSAFFGFLMFGILAFGLIATFM